MVRTYLLLIVVTLSYRPPTTIIVADNKYYNFDIVSQ